MQRYLSSIEPPLCSSIILTCSIPQQVNVGKISVEISKSEDTCDTYKDPASEDENQADALPEWDLDVP